MRISRAFGLRRFPGYLCRAARLCPAMRATKRGLNALWKEVA